MTKSEKRRKVILDLAVSLDGFIEGPNGEIDWCIMEAGMNFTDFLDNIDTILYGRKSYDLWGEYTPTEKLSEAEQIMWGKVHQKEKIVFTSNKHIHYEQAKIIHDNIADRVNDLKNKPGKDMWLYGGASLITTFINLRLVDEYRLSVHPIILGDGKPLFTDINQRVNLKLVESKPFSSGVVQLIYHASN